MELLSRCAVADNTPRITIFAFSACGHLIHDLLVVQAYGGEDAPAPGKATFDWLELQRLTSTPACSALTPAPRRAAAPAAPP